jgi:hypothetical protein
MPEDRSELLHTRAMFSQSVSFRRSHNGRRSSPTLKDYFNRHIIPEAESPTSSLLENAYLMLKSLAISSPVKILPVSQNQHTAQIRYINTIPK